MKNPIESHFAAHEFPMKFHEKTPFLLGSSKRWYPLRSLAGGSLSKLSSGKPSGDGPGRAKSIEVACLKLTEVVI